MNSNRSARHSQAEAQANIVVSAWAKATQSDHVVESPECLTSAQIEDLVIGSTPAADALAGLQHISECRKCRRAEQLADARRQHKPLREISLSALRNKYRRSPGSVSGIVADVRQCLSRLVVITQLPNQAQTILGLLVDDNGEQCGFYHAKLQHPVTIDNRSRIVVNVAIPDSKDGQYLGLSLGDHSMRIRLSAFPVKRGIAEGIVDCSFMNCSPGSVLPKCLYLTLMPDRLAESWSNPQVLESLRVLAQMQSDPISVWDALADAATVHGDLWKTMIETKYGELSADAATLMFAIDQIEHYAALWTACNGEEPHLSAELMQGLKSCLARGPVSRSPRSGASNKKRQNARDT